METKRAKTGGTGWIGLETLEIMADRGTLTGSAPISSKRVLFTPDTELLDGRFAILEVLGSGGEGVVYRALDRVRQREVALKILHLEEGTSRTQIKREFRFLRNLIHPNLVHLHELFVRPEVSFFTMNLVIGQGFLEVAVDHDKLRSLLVQLADALAFLHRAGRVHRDIKPSNLLVRGHDLILVDFGVALDLSAPGDDPGSLIGTPRYLAPEVFRGGLASPKSDAYAVGVLLFEALTGRFPPLPSLGAPTPVPPSFHNRDLPADLDELCLALLEQNPTKRASVEHVLQVLGKESLERNSAHPGGDTFTGRSSELQKLETACAQMLDEQEPVVALVEGASGIGKSALIERFLGFHPGALRLRGQCSEHEFVPHKALDGAMDDLADALLHCAHDEVLRLVPPEDARSLVQLFPELRRVPLIDQLIPNVPISSADLRLLMHQGYAALARVLRRLGSDRQVIVVVDDLQWGDLDSARLLLEMLGGPEPPRCLLILAFRSEEAKSSLCIQTLLEGNESLTDRLRSLRLTLEPLDPRDARTLLSRFTRGNAVPGDVAQEILRDAKGSPLLVTELVSHLELPANQQERPSSHKKSGMGLAEVIQERVRSLSAREQHAFSLLCCAGTLLETHVLSQLSGLDSDGLCRSLETKRLAQSRAGGRKLQVLHDAIREVRLRELGDQVIPLHRSLADELRRTGGEPAQIARHYEQCGDLAQASVWAEKAAAIASQSLALTQAVELYRLARRGEPSDTPRWQVLTERLALALADAGYGSEAAPLFAQLAEAAEPEKALSFRQRAAAQWLGSGAVEQGWNELVRVQSAAGLSWPQDPRQAILQVVAHRTSVRLRYRSFEVDPGALLSREDKLRLNACRAAWSIAYVSTVHGAANSARYLSLALKSKSPEHLALGFGMEALYRATSGTPEQKLVDLYRSRAVELMPRPLGGYGAAFLHYMHGQANYLLGLFKDCTRPYELAEEGLSRCRDVAWELSSSRTFWGSALNFLGRHRELDRRIVGWIRDARERGDLYALTSFELLRLRRHSLRDGDHEDTLHQVDEAASAWRSPYVGVHYSLAALTRGHIATCWRRPDLTLKEMEGLARGMKRSLLSRVQLVRITRAQVESVAAVAEAAKSQGTRRQGLLRLASKNAAALRAERAPWATAFALHAEGNVAWLERPGPLALGQLQRARAAYEELGFEMNAAALTARIGQLIGGDEGRELERQAAHAFRNAESDPSVGAYECFAPELPKS